VRGVLSWFNRRPRVAQGKFTANRSTTSATYVEINSEIAVGFLTWAECAVILGITGTMFNSGVSHGGTKIYVDGAGLTGYVLGLSAAANYFVPIGGTWALGGLDAVSEGYHTGTLYGFAGAGTEWWAGGSSDACTLTANIMG